MGYNHLSNQIRVELIDWNSVAKSKSKKTRAQTGKIKRQTNNASYGIRNNQQGNLQYQEMTSPYKGLSEDQVQTIIKEIGNKAGEVFENSFDDLKTKLLKIDPFMVLSDFSFY